MSTLLAFLGMVTIWSTTPLAIKWSSEEVGFLFAVSSRMLLSLVLCLALTIISGVEFSWNRKSFSTYIAASVGIFGAMISCYWGAQFVSSGLISVVFGLTPLVVGIMSAVLLNEKSLTPVKIAGMVMGFFGLTIIFAAEISSWQGIALILVSVLLHSSSSVLVKKTGHSLTPLAVNTGGLLLSTPLFIATWYIFDGILPTRVPMNVLAVILYLGIIGSTLGFILYFYILKNMEASKVALITLITPVFALFIGQAFNSEIIQRRIWIGMSIIMLGLITHQWGGRKNNGER